MRKSKFSAWPVVVLFALTLNGCVSVPDSPSPRFYMPASLDKDQAGKKFDMANGVILVVGPVAVPGYQDRPQIVTRNKNGTLTFAQFDRWGGPLDEVIARLICDDLALMLPQTSIQLFPCSFAIPLDYQVIVSVIDLESELNKDMAFTCQWSIIDAKNRKMLMTGRSELKEAIDPHNYFGVSKALGAICASLSREIAENLSRLSKQAKSTAGPAA